MSKDTRSWDELSEAEQRERAEDIVDDFIDDMNERADAAPNPFARNTTGEQPRNPYAAPGYQGK